MNKKVVLTVAQKSPPEVIHYVQMSNEIPIEFWLADYDITDTMECRLYIKKPSGSEVYNGAVNDGDHFTYYPTAQSFAESGRQMGQLQIVDGTGDDKKILMSFILLFDIEPNLVEESAIPSSNEFGVLDQLIDDARDAIQDAQNATNAANTAAGTANTAAGAANTAAGQANTAAGAANSAASAANSAKDAANTAAGAANSAAQAANSAAQAANDAAEKIEGLVDLDIPIQISKGGTEADNRVEAASNLLCLPNGTLPSEDTTAEWAKLGNCIIYMNGTKENFNFPTTYGTLIQTLNYENSVTTVQQLWIKQATGQIYNRSGNSVGWNADADLIGSEAWESVWTSRDTVPIINGGTGATSVAGVLLALGIASKIKEAGTYSTWDYITLDDGFKVMYGVRSCTFPDSTNLGDYFRSIESLDLSDALSDIYGAALAYQNGDLIPHFNRNGSNHGIAEIIISADRQFSGFMADVPMVIFGRDKT